MSVRIFVGRDGRHITTNLNKKYCSAACKYKEGTYCKIFKVNMQLGKRGLVRHTACIGIYTMEVPNKEEDDES